MSWRCTGLLGFVKFMGYVLLFPSHCRVMLRCGVLLPKVLISSTRIKEACLEKALGEVLRGASVVEMNVEMQSITF